MSQLQLKDGSFREFTPGQSAAEIVKGIGMGLFWGQRAAWKSHRKRIPFFPCRM